MSGRIQIGTVVAGGRIHLHIDGAGCGAAHRARIASPATDLTAIPADRQCKRCFTAARLDRAARINAMSDTEWNWSLEMFLTAAAPAPTPTVSPDRIAQMIAEMNANFDLMGI